MNFLFTISAIAVCAMETLHADDVIKALERGTQRQEENIKSTTAKLRALQERVNSIFPHKPAH